MDNNTYENRTNIIIPSREYDEILSNTIKKIRLLYKEIKIILILDNIDIPQNSLPDNVIVLKSKSYRMSAKRNQGVMYEECEYIAFLDSDAYPKENWLNCAVKFLDENKEYSAVYGSWSNAENDSFEQLCTRIQRFIPIFSRKEWWKIIIPNAQEQDAKEFISASAIIRRNDYIKTKMMNENLYIDEDIEFSKRFYEQGYKIRFLPKMAVFHRESKIYAYLRKIFFSGYYYSNMLINANFQKELETFEGYFRKVALHHMLPLLLLTLYCITFCLFLIFKLPLFPLFITAIFVLLIIFFSSCKAAFLLNRNRIKGVFLIFYISVLFCIVYIIGNICGLFNIPIKSPYKMFKQ